MSKTIRVDSEAEEELLAAVAWYEGRRPGLGSEFLGSVNQTLARIN